MGERVLLRIVRAILPWVRGSCCAEWCRSSHGERVLLRRVVLLLPWLVGTPRRVWPSLPVCGPCCTECTPSPAHLTTLMSEGGRKARSWAPGWERGRHVAQTGLSVRDGLSTLMTERGEQAALGPGWEGGVNSVDHAEQWCNDEINDSSELKRLIYRG